jgi:hypothetical protein
MKGVMVPLLLIAFLLPGCGTPISLPTPTAGVEIAPSSTIPPTAEAPTATNRPTHTATVKPTATNPPTDTPTPTPTPTNSPTATYTPTSGSAGVDQVIAFNPGLGVKAVYSDPEALLGDPDLVERPCCQGMVQLGRGGSVLLAFTDNAIMDGDGPDFQVYGESAQDDYLLIEVSADGQTWYAYPRASESPEGLNLADAGLARAVYVRLTDLQPATSTGAEVDAVVALHSGPGLGDALPDLPEATARRDLILYEGPHTSMKKTGRASKGTALSVVGQSQSAGWVKVETEDGKSGWCAVADLAVNVSLSDYALAQAPPTPTNTPKPTLKPTATVKPQEPNFTAEFLEVTKDYPCVVQFAERDTSDLSQILIHYYDRDVCNRHPDRQVGVLKVGEKRNLWYQLPTFEHPEIEQGQPPIIGARIVKIREGQVWNNGVAMLILDVEVGGGRVIRVGLCLNCKYSRLYGRHWHVQPSGEIRGWSIVVARTNGISPKVFKVGDWVGLFIDSAMEKAINGQVDSAPISYILIDG